MDVKSVTSVQMREIDLRAEKEFKVTSLQLMENAGKAVAEIASKILVEKLKIAPGQASVLICCGRGNNGGDGIAAARHLKQGGIPAIIAIIPKPQGKDFKPEVHAQMEEAAKEGLGVNRIENPEDLAGPLENCQLVIDALLGTGSKGKPMGLMHKIIQKIMKSGKPILALDIPSGIDADTGYHSGVYIQARWTVTLGLAKTGLLRPHAQRYVGDLIVADIGHPKQLLESI